MAAVFVQHSNFTTHPTVSIKPTIASDSQSSILPILLGGTCIFIWISLCFFLFKRRYDADRIEFMNLNTPPNDSRSNVKRATILYGQWSACNKLPSLEYENTCIICFGTLFHTSCESLSTKKHLSNCSLNWGLQIKDLESCSLPRSFTDTAPNSPGRESLEEYANAAKPHERFSLHFDSVENENLTRKWSAASNAMSLPVVILQCQHIFHECCIQEWAMCHKSCPVCRFEPTPTKPLCVDGSVESPSAGEMGRSNGSDISSNNNIQTQIFESVSNQSTIADRDQLNDSIQRPLHASHFTGDSLYRGEVILDYNSGIRDHKASETDADALNNSSTLSTATIRTSVTGYTSV